jgi:quinol monooxygenase YgiN
MSMIFVIATVEVAEGKRSAFLEEFHKVVPHVHTEAGCIEYGPTIDITSGIEVQEPLRDNVVTIMEKWENHDSLMAHLTAPHMKTYRANVKNLVVGMKINVLQPA